MIIIIIIIIFGVDKGSKIDKYYIYIYMNIFFCRLLVDLNQFLQRILLILVCVGVVFSGQKCNLHVSEEIVVVSFVSPEATRPQGPSRGNVWDHAEGISGRREYAFCNSDQRMDLNNNRFLYMSAHLIALPGFFVTVLSQLQKIHHRVKSKWLRIGFLRRLRGQCVHRRFTKVLLMT